MARETTSQARVVLVTGGSGGIGHAICVGLAEAGYDIALTYHLRRDAAETVTSDIAKLGRRVHATQLDITDSVATQTLVDDVIARFGRLDAVVYASGPSMEFRYIHEIAPEEWARIINTDVNGCFNLVAAVLPKFKAQGGGNIVAVVTGAVDRPPPRDILSAAPKAAIKSLIMGLAREEGRHGIRANCVGPGYVEAGLGLATINENTEEFVRRMVKAIPLKRVGQPEDIADVVCFLLSDKARYVTGETIAVAGGLQLV